jgi:hypothetical protein
MDEQVMDLGELPAPVLRPAEPAPRRSEISLAVWLALPMLVLVVAVTAVVNARYGDGAFTHGMRLALPWGMATAGAYFLAVYVPIGIVMAVRDRRR